MQFFIKKDGIPQGPHSLEGVSNMDINGSLAPHDLARVDEASPWIPLEHIPEFGITTPLLARTSRLAIWSLVTGIAGLVGFALLFPPLPLLAIVMGHVSLWEIRKSRGALSGGGIGKAGFILGYIGLLIIACGVAIVSYFGQERAKTNSNRQNATSIRSAISRYHDEYGTLPSTPGTIDTSKDSSLAKTLLGNDTVLNVKNISFLGIKKTSTNKDGLNPSTAMIYDTWGRGYQVVLHDPANDKGTTPERNSRYLFEVDSVTVFSLGKDGIAGTRDDISGW